MLYIKGLVIVVGSIVSVDTINKWVYALLTNSTLIEAALLVESVLRVVKKQLKS